MLDHRYHWKIRFILKHIIIITRIILKWMRHQQNTCTKSLDNKLDFD